MYGMVSVTIIYTTQTTIVQALEVIPCLNTNYDRITNG